MNPVFACDMLSIPTAERARHHALSHRLTHEAALDTRDIKDGVTFSFASSELDDVVQFLKYERLCCPFLTFALGLSPNQGRIELTLSGPPGAAEFIKAELRP
jgi:hypothetical protein